MMEDWRVYPDVLRRERSLIDPNWCSSGGTKMECTEVKTSNACIDLLIT